MKNRIKAEGESPSLLSAMVLRYSSNENGTTSGWFIMVHMDGTPIWMVYNGSKPYKNG